MLDFNAAMQLWVVGTDPPVQLSQVHATYYRNLLYKAIAQHPCRLAIREDLGILQMRYPPDRWQALKTLEYYGIPLEGVVSR